jgi:hypothetical protein
MATIDLNTHKKIHQDDVSFYIKNVGLIFLRQKYKYKEYEEKNDTTERRKLLLDALKFVGISGCDRAPNYQGVLQFGPD